MRQRGVPRPSSATNYGTARAGERRHAAAQNAAPHAENAPHFLITTQQPCPVNPSNTGASSFSVTYEAHTYWGTRVRGES